jgi:hypothetical protein
MHRAAAAAASGRSARTRHPVSGRELAGLASSPGTGGRRTSGGSARRASNATSLVDAARPLLAATDAASTRTSDAQWVKKMEALQAQGCIRCLPADAPKPNVDKKIADVLGEDPDVQATES